MQWKTPVLWSVLAICFLGATFGCEKQSGGDKPAKSNPVPANTTDSK